MQNNQVAKRSLMVLPYPELPDAYGFEDERTQQGVT